MSPDWQVLLGPFGLVIAAICAVIVLWRRLLAVQAELAREHEARLADSKSYTEALLRITETTHGVIDRLSEYKTPPNQHRVTSGTNQRA